MPRQVNGKYYSIAVIIYILKLDQTPPQINNANYITIYHAFRLPNKNILSSKTFIY